MAGSYPTFRKYRTLPEANDTAALLRANDITCYVTDNLPALDTSFSGGKLHHEYEVKIRPLDFGKAQQIIEADAEDFLDEIDDDHYLFTFSEEELYDIVLKPDEWSELDFLLAKKLLSEKGKPVNEALIKSLRRQRIAELAKPETNQKAWIIAGYIFAFLGGFIAIIIGYVLKTSKKTLPDGSVVYSYTKKDRIHGENIFVLGILFTILWLAARLLVNFFF